MRISSWECGFRSASIASESRRSIPSGKVSTAFEAASRILSNFPHLDQAPTSIFVERTGGGVRKGLLVEYGDTSVGDVSGDWAGQSSR